MLKPLADIADMKGADFFDWGQDAAYQQAIGVGECAGVSFDMVGAIIGDAVERLERAKQNLAADDWGDGLYNSYSAFVIGAKALLLAKDVKCNTHIGILDDFDQHYVETGIFSFEPNFKAAVLKMKKEAPSEDFAKSYFAEASDFVKKVIASREQQLGNGKDKIVIDNYYKA